MRKGIELQSQGHYEEAIKCYREGLSIRPESMLPYYQMACSYAIMNQQKEMMKCVDKAILVEEEFGEFTGKKVYYLEALAMYITLIIDNRKHEKLAGKEASE